MNVNFGLFPPIEANEVRGRKFEGRFRGKEKSIAKKRAMSARALADCRSWLGLPAIAEAAE